MKKYLISLTIMISMMSFHAHAVPAHDHILFTKSQFEVVAPSLVEEKFEDTLFMPENFLKIFNPAGVTVTKKVISGNAFQFVVVKRILGFPKQFDLRGTLTYERLSTGCLSTESAYLGHMDFTPSGPSITDTIAEVTLQFCVAKKSETSLLVKSTNTLYYRGDAFGSLLERVAKNLIDDQIAAIATAIKADVQSKK